METVLTFGASLIVSLLCIPFAAVQRNRAVDAIEGLIADALRAAHTDPDKAALALGADKPLVDRTQVGALLSQALDVGAAFPVAVLTAIAYLSLTGSDILPAALLLLAAVAVTLGLVWLASPKNLSFYLRFQTGRRGGGKYGVSLVTSLLVLANVIGLVIAIVQLVVAQSAPAG